MARETPQSGVSRRAFLKVSGPMTAGALSLSTGSMRNVVAGQKQSEGSLKFGLQNKQFSLGLSSDDGMQVLLKHLPSGIELANGKLAASDAKAMASNADISH